MYCVTSFTLVWIKILVELNIDLRFFVTSFTLVWIKIPTDKMPRIDDRGHELHARVD